jgi:hypothetical protein
VKVVGHSFGNNLALAGLEGQDQCVHSAVWFFVSDDRFPDYGKIELVFSATPEKIQGR